MYFDIDKYKGNFGMHCKTEEEAKSFCKYLHSLGRTWLSGTSYKTDTLWKRYLSRTVYDFNENTFANMDWFKFNNYTILEWEDFMKHTFTKEDLKTGDVVKRRNGDVDIVNLELGMLINVNSWNDLDSLKNDLTDTTDERYDIIAVRRPRAKSDCQFKAFRHNWGTLVYERKEVEEMTLEEVCRLLGKEIKIVK